MRYIKEQRFGTILLAIITLSCWVIVPAKADEFSKEDLTRWKNEYMTVVKQGRQVFTDGKLGTNGVACAQCHPNASNTHPETYPKFQKQLGRVIGLRDMINWCLINPLEGKELAADERG